MVHQEEISKQLDSAAELIKLLATEQQLTFMKNIGVDGTFRSFIDVKMANLLHKRGWIEKGHSPHKNLIVFYVESAIYHRLF